MYLWSTAKKLKLVILESITPDYAPKFKGAFIRISDHYIGILHQSYTRSKVLAKLRKENYMCRKGKRSIAITELEGVLLGKEPPLAFIRIIMNFWS
jgi:hypothetical protein